MKTSRAVSGETPISERFLPILLLLLCAPLALRAGSPPDHSWNPSGANPPYGFANEFSPGKYEHCRWGVFQSDDFVTAIEGSANLSFTPLTSGPFTFEDNQELFVTTSLTALTDADLLQFSTGSWTPPSGGDDGQVRFFALANTTYSLFRKLHFQHDGTTHGLERIGGGSMDGNSRKAIILIHGWNPGSDPNSYDSANDDAEFVALKDNLQAALAASPDWQLFVYHWEKDADTGENISTAASVHGTRAAEIAHLHGQYLGELIESLTDRKVEKVQLIAHSAGSWAARAAAKHLLTQHTPGNPVKIQVTLLDPFIPGAAVGSDSSLSKAVIDGLDSVSGANTDTLFRLENYYSIDPTDTAANDATSQVFSWRASDENGLEVGGGALRTLGFDPYGGPYGHFGPIQYYADTVQTSDPAAADRLARAYLVDESSLSLWGWRRSIFYNEPVVLPRNPTVTEAAGGGKTLTGNARRRGAQAATTGILYRWEVSTISASSGFSPFNGATFGTSPVLNLTSTEVNAGRRWFRIVAKTDAGFDTGNAVEVGPKTPTSITAPSALAAKAVSAARIDLTWQDNSNNETGFRLQRRTTGAVFADIPTAVAANGEAFANTAGLAAGTTYFYRIRAFNGTGYSDWSDETSATTQPAAGGSFTLTIQAIDLDTGGALAAEVYTWTGGSTGLQSKLTPFNRSFPAGTEAKLACLPTVAGKPFKYMQLGDAFRDLSTWSVVMDSDRTVVVAYGSATTPGKVLSRLTIEGPSSVDERSSAQYQARATYTDGTSGYVNADWDDDSGYADISGSGLLDTDAVSGDRDIAIEATVTAGGVTKSDTKGVTIRNTDEAAIYTLTLNTTIGGAIGFSPKGSSYADGTVVSLHANRDSGFVFSHWSGDVTISDTDDDITVLMDRNRSITAHFVVDATVGNIRVDILPPQAVAETAGWKYDNYTAWRPSGDTLDGLSPRVGRYVNFKDIPGWITPDSIKADIRGGETTVISGAAATYHELPGVVQVALSPEEAGTAGGRWRLDNGPWLTSGASVVDVVPGNHQVEFQAVLGWTPPQNRQITVQRAGTSIVLGEYQPPLGMPHITAVYPRLGPIEGGTAITIDGVNFTADANVLIGGRAANNVTFVGTTRLTAVTPSSPVFGSMDVIVKAGANSATNRNAFTYGVPRGTNITLVSSIGGMYQSVACNNQNLFVGQGATFQVYDISTPSSPLIVSSITVPGIIRAIALNGNYAVVAANDAGVHILDISNPATPRLRGFYNTSGTAFGVKVLAGRAYVADLSRGLVILDVANPDAPVLISSLALGTAAYDVALRNSTTGLFALLSTNGRLLIVDISNPQLPSMYAEAVVEGSGNNYSLALAGNLAFLGRQANGVDIVDISNLENPVLQGRILENNIYATVGAVGDIVVLAGRGPSGFKVMNVSGVTATERGRLDSSEFSMDTNDSYRCAIQNGIAWIAGGTAVYGVNISNADAPQRIFRKDELAGRFEMLAMTGSSIAASSVDHLFGFNYSANAVTPVAALTHEGQSRALVVASGVLLDFRGVYYGDVNGTRVLRSSMEVGSLFQSMNASVLPQMYAQDGYRIGNRVLNLSRAHSDDHPIICELDPTRADAGWIVRQQELPRVQGSFAEHIVGSQDFFIISFANNIGNSLQRYGWGASAADWEISGLKFVNVLRLSHANRFLHVGMQQEYRLYDLINPGNPVCLSTNSIISTVRDIVIDGDDVYLAAHGQGVLVLDMSNRTELALKRSYDTPGGAFAIAKIGDRLIVADYGAGIQVLGLPDITPPQVFIAAPVALQEFQTTSSSLTLGGGAVDDSGQVTRVAWSNDRGGGGLAEGTADWLVSTVILHPGTNVLTVTAFDAEGNSSTDQITVISTQPDTTAPAITITGPKTDADFAVSTETITLSGSAADNQSVATVTWSNGVGGSGPATLTGQSWTVANLPLVPGPNVIQVTATDANGNSDSDTAVIFLVPPDTTRPLVTIDFPTANAVLETSTGELNLSGLASDDQGVVRVEWSDGRGGQGVAAGAFPWSVNGIVLLPGLNVFEVTAFDAAGNSASDALTVTYVVLAPPAVTLDPVARTVNPGDLVAFTVAASGSPTLLYQWRKNAVDLSGQTAASLTIAAVTAGDAGSYDCVVSNPAGSATSAAAVLTVRNIPPVLTAIGDKSVAEHATLVFVVTAGDPNDTPANVVTLSATGLPAGASFNSVIGAFAWTPGETQQGEHSVTFTATDDGVPPLAVSETITITVAEVNAPPVLTAIGAMSVSEGVALGFTVSAGDPDDTPANAMTLSVTGLPDGATFNPATGAFAWTPGEAQQGSHQVTFTATDNGVPPLMVSETIIVTVNEVNTVPVLAAIGAKSVNEAATLNFSVTAGDQNDTPANTVTLSVSGLPVGATFDPATGAFAWTPGETQQGEHQVTLTATDDGVPPLGTSETVTITVGEVNTAPAFTEVIPPQTLNEGVTLTLTNQVTDADQPANLLAFSLPADAPTGAAVDAMKGVFIWKPSEVQGPGSYLLKVIVTDDGVPPKSATNEFTVTVGEVNAAPVLAANGAKSVNEAATLNFNVTAGDPNDTPANAVTLSVTGLPAGATFDPATGAFTWTPGETQQGEHQVSFTATDDGVPPLAVSETVMITVAEVNAAPLLTAIGAKNVDEGAALAFTVTASDPNDTPANAVTFSTTGLPTGAAFDPATGAFAWIPTEAQGPGSFSVTFTATDDGLPPQSVSETVTITVAEVNSAPVFTGVIPPQTIEADATLTFNNQVTDSDQPANGITFSLLNPPAGATVGPVTGTFTWTPTAAQAGTVTIQLRATDDAVPPLSATREFTVTVESLNDPPTVVLTSPVAGSTQLAPATIQLKASANDPDGAVAKVEFFHGNTSLGEDTTPPFEVEVSGLVAGEYTFSARATDNSGATATSPTVTITVAVAFTEIGVGDDGTVHLELLGEPGEEYEVQTSTDLSAWSHVANTTAGPDGSISQSDTPPPGTEVRFYRVIRR